MGGRAILFTAVGGVFVCFVAAVVVLATMSMMEKSQVTLEPLAHPSTRVTTQAPKPPITMPVANSVAGPGKTVAVAQPGSYQDYSAASFNAAGTNNRVLFFHAPWCSQCRALDADIKANGVPAGVSIFKVDYDSNFELRKQYGITLQTTVVRVDAAGTKQSMFVPYSQPTLANALQGIGL